MEAAALCPHTEKGDLGGRNPTSGFALKHHKNIDHDLIDQAKVKGSGHVGAMRCFQQRRGCGGGGGKGE